MRVFAAVDAVRARLPTDWTVTSLKRIAWLREDQNVGGDFGLLSLRNTGELAPRGDDVQPPSPEYIPRYWLVGEGNLVVNPMWLAGGAIGVSRVSGAVSPDYRVYELSDALNPRYVHHLVRSTLYNDQYRLLMRAETTFDRRVTKADFADLPLLLPPIATQRRVADLLDVETARIDALIEKKRRMIAILVQRHSTLADRLISGATTRRVRLSRVLATRISDGPHETPEFLDEGVPFLSVDNVVDGRLVFDGTRKISPEAHRRYAAKCRPRRGDVIVTKAAAIGRVALVETDLEFNIWSPLAVLRSDRSQVQPEFLYHAMRATAVQDQIQLVASSNTQQNVAMTDLASLHLLVPPLPDQERIAAELTADQHRSNELRQRLEATIRLLTEHRQALITAAVTGQLDMAEAAA